MVTAVLPYEKYLQAFDITGEKFKRFSILVRST